MFELEYDPPFLGWRCQVKLIELSGGESLSFLTLLVGALPPLHLRPQLP